MPNWCVTNVLFFGDRDKVKKLYEDWDTAINVIADGDDGWLGRLLAYNDIGANEVYCRGFVDTLELQENGVYVISEDAWAPMFDFYDLIAELYGLQYVLMAEEPGNGLYLNTDTEGRYFPERYMLEVVVDDEEAYKGDKLIETLQELSSERYFDSFEPIAEALALYGVHTDEDMEAFQNFIYEKYPNICFEYGKFESE